MSSFWTRRSHSENRPISKGEPLFGSGRLIRERLESVFNLEEPDRTPVLGGWIAYPDHIMAMYQAVTG